MKISKIDIMEIVPANDVLMDDLDNIKGGRESAFHVCLKGCVGGETKPKEEEVEVVKNP
ncbi:hypothetical protein [Limibacterium fermenti]|jgi:hypothetical protein|uniref:hypothetical protein n=1 Tax=Limibacterium fermenti TaxID=3229863 RepID=UPI00267FB49E